jgi:hypothetical protein
MSSTSPPAHRVDISQPDALALAALAAGDSLDLLVPLPSHGSSQHAWDLFHDLACALWLVQALAPHTSLRDAAMSEGHLRVTLSLVLDVRDPAGVRATLAQAHPLWSADDALDAERVAVDCEVLDFAELAEPDTLRALPDWLSRHFFHWRTLAEDAQDRDG